MHIQTETTDETAGTHEGRHSRGESSISRLQYSSHATAEEYSESVDPTDDQLDRNLDESNKETKASEVEGLSLQESAEPKVVLLKLRGSRTVCIDVHRGAEFEATHEHAHERAEASTAHCNQTELQQNCWGVEGNLALRK